MRYSLSGLFGLTIVIGLSVGLYQLQSRSGTAHPVPFEAFLAVCAGICAAGFAVVHDCRRRHKGTALDAYRQRCRAEPLPPVRDEPKQKDTSQKRSRKKWWLRRKPNRFRSISHRDMQVAEPSGYYIRDD